MSPLSLRALEDRAVPATFSYSAALQKLTVTAAQGDQIKVTVSLPFDRVTWLPVPIFLGGKTLSSSVVMRKESNNS